MNKFAVTINGQGTIAVDDTLLIQDAPATAGSRMLEGFTPLFSAEVVDRLQQKGYQIAGKTHVGEFGLDLVGEFSYTAPQQGTLQGAAALAVAEGDVQAALGVDMNGATRRAAALAGVDFLKPTYGTVSRYGVISCAASGEQVGVYAKTAQDVAKIMTDIAGHDPKDGTCLKTETYDYTPAKAEGKTVAVVKNLVAKADDGVKAKVQAAVTALQAAGVTVVEIDCDLFALANTAWQILMCAETCNNVSRYDGVKYGHRAANYKNIDELYVNSRTEGFNFLTKAVILYGSDVLSKNRYKDCYDKSLRVRRVVREAVTKLFGQYDALLTPATFADGYQAYEVTEAFGKVFTESECTALANLIGTPALATQGVQLFGKAFDEAGLLGLAVALEKKGE
ncbi:MAG: hypothetical protein IKT68_02880 [Clostridia bacterium]|nr:hypothetical protein [Clostridia bacterium]